MRRGGAASPRIAPASRQASRVRPAQLSGVQMHPCAFSRAVLLSRSASIVGALALVGANASPGAAPGRALFCQPSRGQRGGSIGAACGALAPLGGAPGKAQGGGLQRGTIAASDR
eukprot:COSAG06_NODE_4204_length_4480_cov_3.149509_4_plen_115_part_00